MELEGFSPLRRREDRARHVEGLSKAGLPLDSERSTPTVPSGSNWTLSLAPAVGREPDLGGAQGRLSYRPLHRHNQSSSAGAPVLRQIQRTILAQRKLAFANGFPIAVDTCKLLKLLTAFPQRVMLSVVRRLRPIAANQDGCAPPICTYQCPHHSGSIGPNCPVWRFLGDAKIPPCPSFCEPVAGVRGPTHLRVGPALCRITGLSTGRQQSNFML